jgi:hypothetical protein
VICCIDSDGHLISHRVLASGTASRHVFSAADNVFGKGRPPVIVKAAHNRRIPTGIGHTLRRTTQIDRRRSIPTRHATRVFDKD